MMTIPKHNTTTFLEAALLCGALMLAGGARAQQETHPTAGASATVPAPLARGKKLILKDGGDLLVSSYEIQGERLRYYSTERSEWEEIPTANVDWEATRKAETEMEREQEAVVAKLRAHETARKAETIEVDASIEAAPGVFLPPGAGLFYVEGHTVLPLTQAATDEKVDKRHMLEQVLVPIPIVPSRRNVVLKGTQAAFRITNRQPEFFIRTADGHEPQIELIQARVRKNERLIENLDTLFKQQNAQRKTVPLQSWELAQGVYRLTLGAPLGQGEYALAEVVTEQELNLLVWDFGVDPAAAKKAKPSPH